MKVFRALVVAFLSGLMALSADAAAVKATFSSEVAKTEWLIGEIDPTLPTDWSDARFLVVEFRSSTSQRFELGLVSDEGNVSKRIHPFAGVWTRAAIPMRFFRDGLGDADELASTVNQPRASYWINIEAGGHAPIRTVRAISVTMRYPARVSTLEIRKVSLAKTDPGDAILDGGTPLIDDYGQYVHADWPGKARDIVALVKEWQAEERMLVPKAASKTCRYGGFASSRRKASGFFRVEKIDDRWWFVDPEGCRFWSAGVNGAGADPPRTHIIGRSKLFASIPQSAQIPTGTSADPLRDPVSFYLANLEKRFGEDWRARNAHLTSRRMRDRTAMTWGWR